MKRTLSVILITATVFTNGCAYYSNRVDVGFEDYGYTNCDKHKPINLWWKATVIDTDNLGLIYYGEKYYGRNSVLTIGFIQMPKTMDRVEINSLSLQAPGRKTKPVALISKTKVIPFENEEFPLFDKQSPEGISVPRDYAELEVEVDLIPKRKPYLLHMNGRYIYRSGQNIPFKIEESIRAGRERKLQSIWHAF